MTGYNEEVMEILHSKIAQNITTAFDAGQAEERARINTILNDLATNPPMRGDIAISDLRRLINKGTE